MGGWMRSMSGIIGNEYCRLKIEYLKNSFHFKKDGAKPPARRGCSAYASESDIHQYSICNLDKIVKSRFKDWMPACAGMTSVISI